MNDFLLKPILFFITLLLVAGCAETPVKVAVPNPSDSPSQSFVKNPPVVIHQDKPETPFYLETPFFNNPPIAAKNSESTLLYPTQFSAMSGWTTDNHLAAFTAFRQSCQRWKKMPAGHVMAGIFDFGNVSDWAQLCEIPVAAGEERQFFEQWFKPYAIVENGNAAGLFTGYYLPELHGSYTRSERYHVPIYRTPDDLVSIGKKSGRRINGRLVPHYDRASIYNGALENKNLELVWVDDEVDAYFMDVQGSGRILLEDGSVMGLGYAAKNGHGYFAIGTELVNRGEISKEDISMQTIRTWIKQHPQEGFELMKKNPSFVFFRVTSGESSVGPTGAMGVPLTAERSLAVDRHYLPLGIPIWLNAQHPSSGNSLQRLVMAQDTGGAIKGAIRGDFYWGQGAQAGELAGIMKSKGQFYVLLPRHLYSESTAEVVQQ